MTISNEILGQAACLGATLLWAMSLLMFRRPIAEHGAWTINLIKNLISLVLLGATLWISGLAGTLLETTPTSLLLVAVSGLVGLTLGDTALFAAVHRIGVHRSLLLLTLAPIFTTILAVGFFGETLAPMQIVGMITVLAGVLLVVLPSRGGAQGAVAGAGAMGGIVLGALSAVGQGAGVALAKAGMTDLPFLPAAFLRISTAVAGLIFVSVLLGRGRRVAKLITTPKDLRQTLVPSFMGAYVAILLMMAGIAFAPASVAAVLLTTSPVFSLFLAARFEGIPITARGFFGTALAISGVAILSLGI